MADDLELLRRVMARELDTINEYETFARVATSPDIAGFFRHLANEEKEHVAEALLLIRSLDPVQEQKLTSPTLTVEHITRGKTAEHAPSAPAPLDRAMATFTVGSLKGS